ncbi:uncharacterized protein LOC115628927 [Scaptodrosophila lebanonensis]|uniref:Uncharacterized protein LOC115628927 n=1 Tax=Drosophila lebanonensis TaxID=7225 RepID=A0A6J2TY41_DROLE|nr:uncharacterized protein LOC115628927 [Scaptodrosophila lebanonensis]
MRSVHSLLLLLACSALVLGGQAKTVFRRTDKISENFKQLDLPPEEIDPNVAPEPMKVQTIDAEDVISTSAQTEELDNSAAAISAAPASTNELGIDESANEIPSAESAAPAEVPAATAAAAANAANEANAADVAPAAAAAAATVATTVAPKPTKQPAKPSSEDSQNGISRYCKCSESHCDCCRKFGLPLIPSGPGCAKISYLGNDEMSVSIKYGDLTLASRRISAKKARPICVGLPGGYSKFCGRVYGLSRAKENFKACLAFELRADDEVEAALRVSCFKFGPEGLRVAEAEPLPTEVNKEEDDDDDDIFGFAGGGDDDEDEEDYDDAEEPEESDDDDADDYTEDDDAEAPGDADYGGFSLGGLLDELDDDEDEKPSKKPAASAVAAVVPAADQTRENVDQKSVELAQSKDEAGTAAAPAAAEAVAAAASAAGSEAAQSAAAVEEAVSAVTAAPAAAVEATTAKSKKSKKAKKNKKKKAAAEASEGDFAYELLNGILDFFN